MSYPNRPFVSVLLTAWFAVLVCLPTLAQDEPDFSESPNALREQRAHQAALQALIVDYFKSVDVAEGRFAQGSIAHTRRYTDALNRSKSQHTRAGKAQAAALVQAAIDRATQWTFTAPDAEGEHFLSDVDLVVAGDDDATKLGTDLRGRIDRLGTSFQSQLDSIFSRYEKRVDAAHKEYRKALEKTLAMELRAGRHKAVIQIEDAIEALKNQGKIEVDPPQRHQEQDGPAEDVVDEPFEVGGNNDGQAGQGTVRDLLDKGYPEAMRGVYAVNFASDRSSRAERLLLILREDGIEAVCWYYESEEKNKLRPDDTEVRLIERDGSKLMLYTKSPIGRDMIFRIDTATRAYDSWQYWTSIEAYKAQKRGGSASAYKIRKAGEQKALQDGKYELKMQLSTDPNRNPVDGEVAIQIEVIGGVVYRPLQKCKIGTKNLTLYPAAFPYRLEESLTRYQGELQFNKPRDTFEVDNDGGGEPSIKYWWAWHDRHKGLPPNMAGKVVPVKE